MKPFALVGIALLAASQVTGAEAPENYIKYRQATMKAIGGHMGASSQIVRGKVSPEGHLVMHADALAALSSDLTALFPEGSDFGETKAKDAIWENWSDFEKAAADAKQATSEFAAAAGSGDADRIKAAHKALGKACKGCHEDYRVEDD